MEKINNKFNLVNYLLIIFIIIYEIFFDKIKFRYDFILISIFLILNLKNITIFYKENKLNKLLILSTLSFLIFNIIQAIILKENNVSIISAIYNYRYIIINLIFPILLFISIKSMKLNEKEQKIINYILVISCFIVCIYGIITYIFDINLVKSGMHILSGHTGRITSFFKNPNLLSLYLVLMLAYILFNASLIKSIKYILSLLIMISICLTYGRYMYFLMLLIIFSYILYIFLSKKGKKLIIELCIIFSMVYITFMLPNNNYLYISLTYKADQMFQINITETVDKIIDNITITKNQTDSKLLYEKVQYTENSNLSSTGTRKLFKNIALELFNENKLIGIGSLNYHDEVSKKLNEKKIDYVTSNLPHNNYIYLLCNYGIIGTILFCLVIFSILLVLFPKSKNSCLNFIIYIIFLIANLNGDFMLRIFIPYILIAINLNINYTNNITYKLKGGK